MIISHRWKFIFIRTYKTASTGVEAGLSRICGPDDVLTPLGLDERLRVGPEFRNAQNWQVPPGGDLERWENLPKAERKPLYWHHIAARKIRRRLGPEIWDRYHRIAFERNPWDKMVSWYFWRNRKNPSPPSFREFVNLPVARRVGGLHRYSIKDEIAVDRVCLYENLDAEMAHLADHVGSPIVPKPLRAKTQFRQGGRDYREWFDVGTREIVAKMFAEEIELFGYEF